MRFNCSSFKSIPLVRYKTNNQNLKMQSNFSNHIFTHFVQLNSLNWFGCAKSGTYTCGAVDSCMAYFMTKICFVIFVQLAYPQSVAV